jgi:hypothetical protein
MTTLIPKFDLMNGGTTPTGAVNRSIQEKLSEVISVKDFGAKGDGTTNDTTAFQNAINAAQGGFGMLYVPYGTYLVGDLTISAQTGLDIIGERKPSYSGTNDGAKLLYSGTGYCLNIANVLGAGTFIYRVNIKNLGINFVQTTVNGGINAYNIQESLFENVSISGTSSQTISYGFNFNGASITNIDNCVIQYVSVAINTQYTASSQAIGAVNITRNNIYKVTTGINFGLINTLNIENNWIEGFQNALLFSNSSPNVGTNTNSLNVFNNTFQQSTASLSQTRVINVGSFTNTNSIYLHLNFANNFCYMAAGSATKPDYAIGFSTSTNSSIVEINAKIYDNWFMGVNTSGIYVDSSKPIIAQYGNITRDAFYGNLLTNITTSYASVNLVNSLYQKGIGVSVPSDTTEDVLYTFYIPANLLGANGMLRIKTEWTCTNNANVKTARIRNGVGGTIIAQSALTSSATCAIESKLSNRNATNSQVTYSQTFLDSSVSNNLYTSSIDTTSVQTFVITGQKATAGDTLTLETLLIELISSY